MANRLKIKICGIRTLEAAQVAASNGAAMLGLVFYPPSPRYLSPEAAARLVVELAGMERRPALVGLFVDLALSEMAGAAERYGLDYLQLSGDETPEVVAAAAKVRPVI